MCPDRESNLKPFVYGTVLQQSHWPALFPAFYVKLIWADLVQMDLFSLLFSHILLPETEVSQTIQDGKDP